MRKTRLDESGEPFIVECPICGTQSTYVEGTNGTTYACVAHGVFTVGVAVAKETRRRHGE